MTKFLNISKDNTLGGSSASDEVVSSQKAVKEYCDSKVGSTTWGNITGTLSNQTDLNNALNAKQDEATAVNYDNITNCITEIPQDIKLELNNGTLTLKAGSKVYVPNGVGVFDVVTLTADKTSTQLSNDTRLYFYNGSYIEKFPVTQCYSGSTAPSGQTYMFWYDTTNNVVKRTTNSGSTWESGWSLPFCIATASSGALTSIDQVFNGFGYIGSTVFALPGVKGLIPNGRNNDGTLKNIEVITDKVTTLTYSSSDTARRYLIINSIKEIGGYVNNIYKKEDNINVDGSGVKQLAYRCGSFNTTSGTISNFTTKTAFHAVDYNDFKQADDNNVKLTGNQDIAGNKTFTSKPFFQGVNPEINLNTTGKNHLWFKNTLLDKTATQTGNSGAEINFIDKNDGNVALLRLQKDANGNNSAILTAYKNSSNTSQDFGVYYNVADDSFRTVAPACALVNSIVTTTGINKAKNGYFKLGNGLIIQWGTYTSSSSGWKSITLPTPFTSTNYAVSGAGIKTDNGGAYIGVSDWTTTSFKIETYDDATHNDATVHWMAIGY